MYDFSWIEHRKAVTLRLIINMKDMRKKRFILFLAICFLSFAAIHAEDDVKVVIPTSKSTNYALYPATTGVFLKLDTRDGTIQAIFPSNPKKNRVINAEPLALDKTPGRFELYPTDSSWVWLLFDTETGEMWSLKWSDKSNPLSKIPINEQ